MSEISIVIPCYNASRFIDRCINALKEQSYKNFEVILIDDCSTDDTWKQLLEIKSTSDLNITLLQNTVNCGPAVSRNNGIAVASSKYITFCDADDWYDIDFLQVMHSSLKKDNSDIVFCGYKVVDENNNKNLRPISKKSGSILADEAFGLDSDSLCMLMVKTSIMKRTPLPNLRNGEDVATVALLLAKCNKYFAVSNCLYNYYRRSDSVSESVPTMKVVSSHVSSFEYTKQFFPGSLKQELEFLGIKNLLYPSAIGLFSMGYKKKEICSIQKKFEDDFPMWYNNKYISNMKSYKRFVVGLLHYKFYLLIWVIAYFRNKILK